MIYFYNMMPCIYNIIWSIAKCDLDIVLIKKKQKKKQTISLKNWKKKKKKTQKTKKNWTCNELSSAKFNNRCSLLQFTRYVQSSR